tara:strand:+ start:17894 stop:18223 length:330 start_codon:yes stop_codon:yes gene_type:complete
MAFNEHNVVKLSIKTYGDLFLELLDRNNDDRDVLLLYLVRNVRYPHLEHYQKMLELCHLREDHPFMVNPCLRGDDRFIFMIHMVPDEVTVSSLNAGIDLLQSLHNRLAA